MVKYNKWIGAGLIVAGMVAAIIALIADIVGLGRDPVFGSQQITLLVVGLVAMAAGIVVAVSHKR